ncbi:cysteine-rich venom protein 6 [Scaptodrosophila lebanonensis]|uniref:Cysteine-rich venom protein 6 n=1 Tax=Drosophila lebanonensis TaxID=7225 RepID=A0A6J2TV61_DROLE|nr:cysteine-rich venom protein 6 [Scaptodrosophila lebanonensis]
MMRQYLLLVLSCLAIVGLVCAQIGTPRKCGPNESYLACGPSCQTECDTLGQPCLIRHIRCPDGCYCNKGYARNPLGRCIPLANCKE